MNILASPARKATTIRLSRTTRHIARQLPQKTLNKALEELLLLVGQQLHLLDGKGPRTVPEFLRALGADVPSWYEYQHDRDKAAKRAQDDEAARRSWDTVPAYKEQKKKEALAAKLAEAWAHAIRDHEAEEKQRTEKERAEQELAAQIERERIEHTKTTVCPKHLIWLNFGVRKSEFSRFSETAPAHPAELNKRSEKLSKLVLLASIYCETFLTIIAQDATPETPTIELEERLERRLGIVRDEAEKPCKPRYRRDSS
jgi:hypothetical protein